MSPAVVASDDRVAIVTGGTRGIGAAVSARLVAQGVTVVAVYNSDASAAGALAAELRSQPGRLRAVRCDVGNAGACADLGAQTLSEFGRVDYLVNNAAVLNEARIIDTDVELWDETIAVNLSAAFHLSRAVWDAMVNQGFGRIVNIGSVTALMGNPVEAAYGASKAGLIGLTRSLARAGARKGITVNCVVPGVFGTDMTAAMSERAQENIRAMIPVARVGHPDELAAAVCFALSDDAAFMTGSSITVDGGLSMGG